MGGGAAGCHAHQNVDVLRHRLQRRIIGVGHVFLLGAGVINDCQAECLASRRDGLADAAQRENTELFAAQRVVRERIGAFGNPFSCAQIAFGLREFPHCHDEKAECCVGDFLGEHVGRVGYNDAVLPGPFRVDRVIADAKIGDYFQVRELRHIRTVDFDMSPRRNRLELCRVRPQICVRIILFPEAMQGRGGTKPLNDHWHHWLWCKNIDRHLHISPQIGWSEASSKSRIRRKCYERFLIFMQRMR